MSIYEVCKKNGVEVASHGSDLYIPVTVFTQRLVDNYQFKGAVKTFTSQIDGKLWFDIPFAYDPFWEKGGINERFNNVHMYRMRRSKRNHGVL